MNRYTAIGNLTKDPECKDAGGSKVCKFAIAINEFYYSNGEKKQNTIYIDIECWSKQAENCTKFLSKGKKVAIDGKLKVNSWEKNGQKYNKIYCLAEKVHFLGGEDSSTNASQTNNIKEDPKEPKSSEDNDYDDIDDIPF
jgi:single-strand DNA-binding protein